MVTVTCQYFSDIVSSTECNKLFNYYEMMNENKELVVRLVSGVVIIWLRGVKDLLTMGCFT